MRYSLPLLFLIAMIRISSVINDISQVSIVTSKHDSKKSGIKRSKCPIITEIVASYNLILSGDVGLNPRPGSYVKNNAAKCSVMQ